MPRPARAAGVPPISGNDLRVYVKCKKCPPTARYGAATKEDAWRVHDQHCRG